MVLDGCVVFYLGEASAVVGECLEEGGLDFPIYVEKDGDGGGDHEDTKGFLDVARVLHKPRVFLQKLPPTVDDDKHGDGGADGVA